MVGMIDRYAAKIDPHMRDARPGEDWQDYKARKFGAAYKLAARNARNDD